MAQNRDMELGTGRLMALSDGVFAIAMTLLIASFDILRAAPTLTEKAFGDMLLTEGPDILSYVESFIAVSAFWMLHHHIFHHIRRTDWRLFWLNMLLLMIVVLIPVTNNALGDHGHMTVVVWLYQGNMLLAGVALCVIWRHATRGRALVDADMPARTIRSYWWRLAIIPAISIVAMVLAIWFPRISARMYYLVPVAMLLIGRQKEVAQEPAGEEAEELEEAEVTR